MCICFVSIRGDNLGDNDVYLIEHSIDSNDFKEIGSVNLRIVRQNQNAAHFQSFNSDNAENEHAKSSNIQYATEITSNKFDQNTKTQLAAGLKSLSSSVYRVRLCKKTLNSNNCDISSFTSLKNVLDANFNINLILHTGINNRLNSISIKTKSNPAELNLDYDLLLEKADDLAIFASIQNIKQAYAPDTESYLEKVKKEIEQKEKGAQGGNESFLSKYWVYIASFLVIMLVMQMVNPEAGQAPSGR